MSCFLSLQVRTGLNQVEQVSSLFETCRDVVKTHRGRSVWGNRPVKAHVSCQDPSVDREDVCDSVCHHYSPFPTWSNKAWSSSVLPVSAGRSAVLLSLFSSHPHNGYIWAILFVPASDLRCGLERISLVGSVQEYFTPCWCHSWMELICIICCLKQHATICSVMQRAPTGHFYPRNAFTGTSQAAVGKVLI